MSEDKKRILWGIGSALGLAWMLLLPAGRAVFLWLMPIEPSLVDLIQLVALGAAAVLALFYFTNGKVWVFGPWMRPKRWWSDQRVEMPGAELEQYETEEQSYKRGN